MKILLVAPIHREREFKKQRGKFPFLIGSGQQSWIDAFNELGHKVYVFHYSNSFLLPNNLRIFLKERLNEKMPSLFQKMRRFSDKYYFLNPDNYIKNLVLINLAKVIKPDLVIISGGVNCIFPNTVKSIKKYFYSKIFLFAGVNPFISATTVEQRMIAEDIIDLVVENDRGYKKKWEEFGARKVVVLPISSCDPKIHKKIALTDSEKGEYGCDVSFVGTLNSYRQQYLASLKQFNLKIWGDIPPGGLLTDLKEIYKGQATSKKMVKVFNASKIVLNFQPEDMERGGNMRTFEIPGSGALQIADKIDASFFENEVEYVKFNSAGDLIQKIKFYLNNPRKGKEIADAGHRRTHKDHTYRKHFEKLFSHFYEEK